MLSKPVLDPNGVSGYRLTRLFTRRHGETARTAMSRLRSKGFLLATLAALLVVLDPRALHASLSKRVSGNLVFWY